MKPLHALYKSIDEILEAKDLEIRAVVASFEPTFKALIPHIDEIDIMISLEDDIEQQCERDEDDYWESVRKER